MNCNPPLQSLLIQGSENESTRKDGGATYVKLHDFVSTFKSVAISVIVIDKFIVRYNLRLALNSQGPSKSDSGGWETIRRMEVFSMSLKVNICICLHDLLCQLSVALSAIALIV